MKICLVNPPVTRPMEDDLVHLPLNLLSLASVANKKKIEVDILDLDYLAKAGKLRLDENFFKDIQKVLGTKKYSVIGITAKQNNLHIALDLASFFKKQINNIKVVLGGPQPTFCDERIFQINEAVDIVVRGEGEVVFEQLLENHFDDLSRIKGITFRNKLRKIKKNADQEYLSDLDQLPLLDLSLINIYDYINYKGSECFAAYIEAGRGCPFSCSFCSSSLMWCRQYRMKSPEKIVSELRQFKLHGIDLIELVHDNFTANKENCIDICNTLIKSDLDIKWCCSSRCEDLDDEIIDLLQKAGCQNIYFGIETGSENIQKKCGKNLNIESALSIIQKCKDHSIENISSFIIGFPYETLRDLNETILVMLKITLIGSNEIQCHLLKPTLSSSDFNKYMGNAIFVGDFFDMSPITLDLFGYYKKIRNNISLFNAFFSYKTNEINNSDYPIIVYFIRCMVNIFPYTYFALSKFSRKDFISCAIEFMEFAKNRTDRSLDALIIEWLHGSANFCNDNNSFYFKEIFEYERILGEIVFFSTDNSFETMKRHQNTRCKIDFQKQLLFKKFSCNIVDFTEKLKKGIFDIKKHETYIMFSKSYSEIDAIEIDHSLFNLLKRLYLCDDLEKISLEAEIYQIYCSDKVKKILNFLVKNGIVTYN